MKKQDLIRKIRKEFPELKWKKTQHNVEGWDHYVLILDGRYVFRFPRTKEYLDKLAGEILLAKYLKSKVAIPIPEYKFVAKDKSFAGYELLPGIQLKEEVFRKLPLTTQDSIAREIAKFMSVMHNVPFKAAKRFDPDKDDAYKSFQDTQEKTERLLFPKFSTKDQVMVTAFLEEFKKYLNFPKRALIHTDLYPSHILLAGNRRKLSGIIDFSDRNFDDPAMDFCELWVYGKRFVETVYKHYTGPKDKDFMTRARLYYKRMPIWMLISTFDDRKGDFRHEYKRFRQIFLDPKTFQ